MSYIVVYISKSVISLINIRIWCVLILYTLYFYIRAELYFVRVQLKGSDNILVGIEICPEYNTALVLVSPLLNDHGRVVKFANGLYVYINNCAVFAGIVKVGESTVNVPT